ncbi:hypothetical protein TWF506_004653 [Arthrobotrys conoides]|uniref:Uncharacterized protein n=1 Tax=Arthrobotrys conoides TaxID=74498 RepID=A0AAN8RP30_9PEZI
MYTDISRYRDINVQDAKIATSTRQYLQHPTQHMQDPPITRYYTRPSIAALPPTAAARFEPPTPLLHEIDCEEEKQRMTTTIPA